MRLGEERFKAALRHTIYTIAWSLLHCGAAWVG